MSESVRCEASPTPTSSKGPNIPRPEVPRLPFGLNTRTFYRGLPNQEKGNARLIQGAAHVPLSQGGDNKIASACLLRIVRPVLSALVNGTH